MSRARASPLGGCRRGSQPHVHPLGCSEAGTSPSLRLPRRARADGSCKEPWPKLRPMLTLPPWCCSQLWFPCRRAHGGVSPRAVGFCFRKETQHTIKDQKKKKPKNQKGKMKIGRKPPEFLSAVRVLLPPGTPGLGIPGVSLSGCVPSPLSQQEPRQERASSSRRPLPSSPLYNTSISRRMGTRGRIRPAHCRLPPAFWSTKVFWSGIMSVVSWVCGQGGSGVSAGAFFGENHPVLENTHVHPLDSGSQHGACLVPSQTICSGKQPLRARSLHPVLPHTYL